MGTRNVQLEKCENVKEKIFRNTYDSWVPKMFMSTFLTARVIEHENFEEISWRLEAVSSGNYINVLWKVLIIWDDGMLY